MRWVRENLAAIALGIAIGLVAGAIVIGLIGHFRISDPGVNLGLGVALGGLISILSSWGFSWWYFREGGVLSALERAQRSQTESLIFQQLNRLQGNLPNRIIVTESEAGGRQAHFEYVADTSTPAIRPGSASSATVGPPPPRAVYDRVHEQPESPG